jgi:signal transduction histidine kinase
MDAAPDQLHGELLRRLEELEDRLRRLQRLQELLHPLDQAWTAEAPLAHALEICRRAWGADGALWVRLDSQGQPIRWHEAPPGKPPSDLLPRLLPAVPIGILGAAERLPQALRFAEPIPLDPEGKRVIREALVLPLPDPWGGASGLILWRESGEGFSEEERELARLAAEPLASRFHHLHALEQQRYLSRTVLILFRVARAMAASPDLSRTLPEVVRIIREETGWPRVAIFVHEPAAGQLRAWAREGHSPESEHYPWVLPIDRGITGRAFRTGEPQRVPDVSRDPDYVVGDPTTRSELAVPIFEIEGERPWGVLDAQSPEPYAFTPDDETLMLAVAGTIGLGLEAAQTYERICQERARLIALHEAYLAIQQHPEPEEALQEVAEAFVRLGWRAARCWAFDESGNVLAQGESRGAASLRHLDLEPWLRNDPHLERYRQGDWLYLFPAEGAPSAGRAVLPLRDASGALMALMELEAPAEAQALGEALRRPTELLATLLRIAFDRGRLLRRYARNLREQTMLYRAVSALLRSDEPGPILTEIAAALCEALEGTSAYFLTVDLERRIMQVAAEYYAPTANPLERASDLGVIYRREETPAEWAALEARQPRVLYADDPPDPFEEERALLRRYGGWSVLMIPLFAEEEPLGVVEVWDSRRRRAFDAGERAIAQAIAQHAALALQRAQLRARLQQANRRLEAILSTMEDAVLLLDARGQILQWNAAAQRLLAEAVGFPPGRTLPDLLRALGRRAPGAARALLQGIRQLRQGREGFRIEISWPGAQGSRAFAVLCAPVREELPGTGSGWLLLFRDITAERERDALREEMIRMLMHDLQNPLGPIRLALEELRSLPELNPEARPLVQVALRGLGRLHGLIDSLLDLARLEAGRMPLERQPLDLGELAREAVEEWSPAFRHRRLRVTLELPPERPPVWADRQLMARTLWNLLSNAEKFTPVGGEIRIRMEVQADAVVLAVFNSGSYIPPEQRERIFSRFETLLGRRGHGLGLAFARLAVEAHGGRIEVESDARGTTFAIRLPLRPPDIGAVPG